MGYKATQQRLCVGQESALTTLGKLAAVPVLQCIAQMTQCGIDEPRRSRPYANDRQ